jgi:signal transduction histidine kinase/DNA-binding NarL/FixJ family response regulator
MHFQYNPHVWVYLGGATLLFLVVAYTIHKRDADRLWIAAQVMVIFWCVGFALQISGADPKTAAFWYIFANDFVGFKVPVVWLLWALTVAGKRSSLTRLRVILLFVLPVLTDIMNLTNSRHGFMYRQMWLDTSGRNPVLQFLCGPWYWVVTAYCGLLLIIVIAVQVKAALNRQLLYRKQGLTIAAATAAILIFIGLCLVTEGALFQYYDLTPVAIGIATIFTSLVFRFRVQEVVPVPRNAVLENLTSAVFILDNSNRVMDLNPAAETFFEIKADKVAGQVLEEVLNDWPELTVASLDKSVIHREFSRGGRHYETYFSGLNDGRKAVGHMVVFQDVTAKKEVEEQLIQQQQALLVLQERERLARELHDSLGQVLGYTNVQIQAIRDLMESSQLPEADSSLARLSQVVMEANTEVREFIYEVKTTLLFKEGFFPALQQYLSHFQENFGILMEMQNPDNLTEEELDLPVGIQLYRIIQEALSNVRKHSQAGKVTVKFKKENEQILVIVADDGMGFDKGKLVSGQCSFGLGIMQERAKQIGGEVRIDSAPGEGTTVTIAISCSAVRDKSVAVSGLKARAADTGTKVRVLLADDHTLFMEGLKNLISPYGFEVVGKARDGLEALEKARLLHPEIILMDLQMPRCNGLAATRLIKAEMPDIKIVILTMSDREQDLFEAIQKGASGYLLKGLRPEELIDQLNGLASSNAAIISPELAAQFLKEFHREKEESASTIETSLLDLEKPLSQRQVEILKLSAEGYIYKEIASRLFISERTVKYEMAEIIKKLQLKNRHQAIAYARKAGLGKKSPLV